MGARASLLVAMCVCAVAAIAATSSPAAGGLKGFSPAPDAGSGVSASGDPALERRAATVARTGNLTIRPEGFPTTATPARRLAAANVTQDLVNDRLRGTVRLAGVPAPGSLADLHVQFGHVVGTTCEGDAFVTSPTAGALAPGFTRSGAAISFDVAHEEAGWQDWDCAFAALSVSGQPPDPAQTYDVLIGPLTDVAGQPKLEFDAIERLRKPARKLKLVKGVWSTVHVDVNNVGFGDAANVRVGGSGKGLKVRGDDLGLVREDGAGYGEIRVKLTKPKRTSLTVDAVGAGQRITRKLRVKPVKPPQKPVSGTYESKDADVSFRIKRGKVVGWHGYMQTRCGGFPDIPTTTWNTYDFPTTKVAKDGVVEDIDDGELYIARLQLVAVGRKVTNGWFSYSGPDRCFALEDFTAKLKRGKK